MSRDDASLRRAFPYHTLPRTIFRSDELPIAPAEDPHLTDTTFRDGQQARPPYSVEQILFLFDALHRLDNGAGVVRQSEFFLYSASERAAVEGCLARGYRFPEVTAWIRARPEDLALVKRMGLAETGMLTSVSDIHLERKLGWSRQEAMDRYLQMVDAALEAGIRPRCHFEDITRADLHGFVVPLAAALAERGRQAGLGVKIRLCDTMGVGQPWGAVAPPRGVPALVRALIDDAGVPGEQLEWHGHNDFFKAHANSTAAWLYGCAAVNTTLLGTGERTGNSPLEAALVELVGLTGESRLDLSVLPDIARYLEQACGVEIAPTYPLLGAEAFSTRAGVHIDGLLKDPETYMSFDPQEVLGRPIGVVVSDRSGAAGIAWWLNGHRDQTGLPPLTKTDPGVGAMYQGLLDRYERGETGDPSDDELLEIARYAFPALSAPPPATLQ